MREIEFRAWHTNEDMFFVGDDFGTTHPLDCAMYAKQGQPVILMQFTGLKDKNGKKIFEGDLLRIPAEDEFSEKTYNCFEVFYHDNECIGGQNIGFCMNRMHTQGHSAGGRGFRFTPEDIEKYGFVICGNIHENGDLLND